LALVYNKSDIGIGPLKTVWEPGPSTTSLK